MYYIFSNKENAWLRQDGENCTTNIRVAGLFSSIQALGVCDCEVIYLENGQMLPRYLPINESIAYALTLGSWWLINSGEYK